MLVLERKMLWMQDARRSGFAERSATRLHGRTGTASNASVYKLTGPKVPHPTLKLLVPNLERKHDGAQCSVQYVLEEQVVALEEVRA